MFLAGSDAMNAGDVTKLLLSLAVLLGAARLVGELARKFRQPAVLGEILAGILLGPTLLGGAHLPEWALPVSVGLDAVFPTGGPTFIALDGFRQIAVTLLMLVAGLEVSLSSVTRQGRAALSVSFTGIFFPFVLGAGTAWLFPESLGMSPSAQPLTFALFVGIALSITALPVIAKTLMDLNLFRSDMGMMIICAAMVDDLLGWIGFAMVMAMMQADRGDAAIAVGPASVGSTLLWTIVFIGVSLTIGRWLINWLMPRIQAHLSWPGGVLGFILVIAFGCAAFTEHIGIHAIFGSFIAGVAIGDSPHLRQRTRELIQQFITHIFAPVFFAGIGLRTDFIASFNPTIVALVLLVAIVSKVGGCYLGATFAKLPHRESLAIGFGMSGRGAMEIILGTLARQAGLITDELFVALVVMALVTSLMAGPAMQWSLGRRRQLRLGDLMGDRQFLPELKAQTVRDAITELAQRAATVTGLGSELIEQAVWQREQIMPTGIGDQLAVPHARLQGLRKPMVFMARSEQGIDFGSRDGRPARLVCLLLIPWDDQTLQLELMEVIARTFSQHDVRQGVMEAKSFTEFLAALNQATPHREMPTVVKTV
jgi:Kef-type K+ transport system membrane component KefB/mannitol/fructose-specific phosphotransferase system IIA component (Ntr-type)